MTQKDNTQRKAIKAIIALAILCGFSFLGYRAWQRTMTGGSDSASVSDTSANSAWTGGASDTQNADAGNEELVRADLASYSHDEPFFTFAYPKQLSVEELTETDGSETILFEGGEGKAFQIHFFPFDEPGPLTTERIKKDTTDITIDDAQKALITADQLPAVLFWSRDASLGKTRELWFVHDGYLYQITALPAFDSQLAGIMTTWKF